MIGDGLLILALLLAADSGGPAVRNSDVGPVRVRVETPAEKIGLADKLQVSFDFVGPVLANLSPCPLARGDKWAGLPVLEVRAEGPDVINGPLGPVAAARWVVVVEPLKLGKLALPPLAVKGHARKDKDDKIGEAFTGQAAIPEVEVLPGATSSDDVRTLRPLPASSDEIGWTSARILRYGGAALAAVVFGLVVFSRPRPDPVGAALADLARLETVAGPRDLVDGVVEALRVYLIDSRKIAVRPLVAAELAANERFRATFSSGQQAALLETLAECDRLRFPNREPFAEEAARALRMARGFLAGERPT
ncbi:MAG TPA: hypothetical protein VNC50_22625 [Planctomycetia bacterium]|nr:hypothetical protein [Planctomycetia bacterium]